MPDVPPLREGALVMADLTRRGRRTREVNPDEDASPAASEPN